ncbi:hypothetical protein N9A94_00785 [Akkermansiaceae bacterium]|nr:hypothetical protein [Akkermansiaceae bacterium]
MAKTVIFHCNYLSANVGVPGVYQALIADLTKAMGADLTVYGSDYKKYYSFTWKGGGA